MQKEHDSNPAVSMKSVLISSIVGSKKGWDAMVIGTLNYVLKNKSSKSNKNYHEDFRFTFGNAT